MKQQLNILNVATKKCMGHKKSQWRTLSSSQGTLPYLTYGQVLSNNSIFYNSCFVKKNFLLMILVKALPHNTFTFECLELKLENCSRNKVKMGSGDYGFILHKANQNCQVVVYCAQFQDTLRVICHYKSQQLGQQ